MTVTLLFTDAALNPLGKLVRKFISVQATRRFNQPASVQVVLPALGPYIEMAQPGNRLIVFRDGKVFCAGPVEYPGIFTRSSDAALSDAAPPGQLAVASTDDSVWLGCRVVYPDPAHAATAQTAAFYTASATNAETAMRALVNLNAGPGALSARRVANLVLGSVTGAGSAINVRSRFGVLSDELRSAALAGGGLGFQVVEDAGQLKFQVFAPVDLSASVRFSDRQRNLRAISYQPQAPTVTAAIVGGDGTGTSRTIVERLNTSAIATWGRIESFVGNSSSNTTDLNQAGDEALTGGAEQGFLDARVIDSPKLRFGVDYNLGDKVAVEVYPGLQVADVVRAVTLTADRSGEVVTPQIGTASASSDPTYVRMLRAIDRRLGVLERT